MTRPTLFELLLKPVSRLVARRSIRGRPRARRPEAGRFTGAEVTALMDRAWGYFDERAGHLPRQPTVGSRLNLHLACLTLGCFRALQEQGVERSYARELVADMCWRVYAVWGRVLRWMGGRGVTAFPGRLAAGDLTPLLFPFNPPGYIARWVPDPTGAAYDVVQCPVATYFRAEAAADLCRSAWCDLDFALAERLGYTLVREKTLVLGDDRCTFRWHRHSAPPPGAGGGKSGKVGTDSDASAPLTLRGVSRQIPPCP